MRLEEKETTGGITREENARVIEMLRASERVKNSAIR